MHIHAGLAGCVVTAKPVSLYLDNINADEEIAMAGLSKQGNAMGGVNQLGGVSSGQGSGLGSMLSSFLDADKDGSVVDDLMGMARKFV